jgi:hypothetical protein
VYDIYAAFYRVSYHAAVLVIRFYRKWQGFFRQADSEDYNNAF